jgi:hypothetical protein
MGAPFAVAVGGVITVVATLIVNQRVPAIRNANVTSETEAQAAAGAKPLAVEAAPEVKA